MPPFSAVPAGRHAPAGTTAELGVHQRRRAERRRTSHPTPATTAVAVSVQLAGSGRKSVSGRVPNPKVTFPPTHEASKGFRSETCVPVTVNVNLA
jgi:hypothetical protein